jgi:hypothetical protein
MRVVLMSLLLTACTEPTWYPGLPSSVAFDTAGGGSGATDSGGGDVGGGDGGGDVGGGGDSGGEDLPCSTDGGAAANLTIDVQDPLSVILYWRDVNCDEWSYGAVPPYTPRVQGTYMGHAWVLRDAVGNYLDHTVVTEANQVWPVTE